MNKSFACSFILNFFLIALLTVNAPLAKPVKQPELSPAERILPAEIATEWYQVSPDNNILEGAIFDSAGNLLFCDVTSRRVLKLSPDRKLTTIVELPDLSPGGLALHKDGRLFMACLDLEKGKGAIRAFSPDTGNIETVIPVEAGFWPNDLVFSPDGGFYFSDFRGNATNPAGGIYYVSPDFSDIKPVIPSLGQANGVALSPDGKTLWATEFAKNRLHRAILSDPVTVSRTGSSIPYHFIGSAPDSMRVDEDGNVYVAMYGQGRVLVFNPDGAPVGQILLPGREKGDNLLSTSLALDPANKQALIVTSNDEKGKPALVFSSESRGKGVRR